MRTISKSYPRYLKRQAMMLVLFIILILFIGLKSFGQTVNESSTQREISVGDGVREKPVKIHVGDLVAVELKTQNAKIESTVLTMNDSMITVQLAQPPYEFRFLIQNIASIQIINCRVFQFDQVEIILISGNKVRGRFKRIDESGMELVIKSKRKGQGDSSLMISHGQMKTIYLWKANSSRHGFVRGAIIGIGLGVILSASLSGGGFTITLPQIIYVAPRYGLMGGIIGAVVGSSVKKFNINGEIINFNKMKEKIS